MGSSPPGGETVFDASGQRLLTVILATTSARYSESFLIFVRTFEQLKKQTNKKKTAKKQPSRSHLKVIG